MKRRLFLAGAAGAAATAALAVSTLDAARPGEGHGAGLADAHSPVVLGCAHDVGR